jgi:hypothetical protein
MHLLSSLGVRFVSRPGEFSREVFAAKDGRLLVRFKYTTKSDYDEAYEINGMTASDLTTAEIKAGMAVSADDWPRWVPQCVRDAWDEWLEGPFCP